MLLTLVIVGILMVITNINGCPSIERPCKTANGTSGSCIQSKDCPFIHRLNGVNLTPDELDYARKSICGIDLDKSPLFCCDNNDVRLSGQASHSNGSPEINISKVPLEHDISQTYNSTYQPIAQDITSTAKPPEVACRTPNGEKAYCISIYQCTVILNNVSANPSEDQKRFLKESSCGFNNRLPLVCCGSDTNFRKTNELEDKSKFRQNPLLPVSYCGFQNFTLPNRIFGGTNSEIAEFPWVVLLNYETHDGRNMFACGGSLISSRYILTAAHCVSGQNVDNFAKKLASVRLGEWDYNNKGQDCITAGGRIVCNDAEINIGIESIHLHPGYRYSSREKSHDIALIRLERDIKFTSFINPICLPNIDDHLLPGERLTISGWGLINYNEETTIKQKVEVPVVSSSQCSIMFERSSRLTRVGSGQFCAGGESGKDSCVGDSGAPLMKKLNFNAYADRWYVEGIVSFGTGCGLVNQYGVYTKVSEYIGWIHSTIVP